MRPVVAFLLALVVLLPATLRRDLWSPDEPRHAEVARTMVETGDYLLPHLAGELYADKPAPPFWAMAASMKLFGTTEWAARLPFVLCTAGTLALVAFVARLLGLSGAGQALACLMLLSAYRFLWLSQRVSLDAMLTFFTTASVVGWLRQWRGLGSPAGNGILFFGCSALGVLTKGPIGLLVPLSTALVHAISTRSLGRLVRPAFLSMGLVLPALVAAWVVPACLAGGEAYASELLFKHPVGMAVDSWSHQRPPWYYLGKLPLEFMPWTPILVLAFVLIARRRHPAGRDAVRFLMSWFAPSFLVLSLASAKRGNYLLPLYPPLALSCAITVASPSVLTGRAMSACRWIEKSLAGLLSLIAIAVAIAPFVPAVRELRLEGIALPAVAVSILLLMGSFLALRAARGPAPGRASAIVAAAVLSIVPVAGLWLLPAIDAVKSPKAVAELLAREKGGAGRYVPFYDIRVEEYRFYSGLDCREVDGKKAFLAALADPAVDLAVVSGEKLDFLLPSLGETARVLSRSRVSDDEVVVLRVRP